MYCRKTLDASQYVSTLVTDGYFNALDENVWWQYMLKPSRALRLGRSTCMMAVHQVRRRAEAPHSYHAQRAGYADHRSLPAAPWATSEWCVCCLPLKIYHAMFDHVLFDWAMLAYEMFDNITFGC